MLSVPDTRPANAASGGRSPYPGPNTSGGRSPYPGPITNFRSPQNAKLNNLRSTTDAGGIMIRDYVRNLIFFLNNIEKNSILVK